MSDILTNMVKCLPEDRAIDYAGQTGANANEDIIAVLSALYSNADPDIDVLRGLGTKLDAQLKPFNGRPPHTTLLNEAVRQHNYRWLIALLEAGADPNGSGSLMAYTAVDGLFHPSSPALHLFRDGAPAVPFLEAYIAHGGVINTTAGGGYGNPALIDQTYNNLSARIFLLENGADPWLISGEQDRLSFSVTTAGSLIWGARAPDQAQQLYVLAKRGLLRPPESLLYREITQEVFLRHLERYGAASGPTDRHKLWTLQKAAHALIEADVLQPNEQITSLLQENAIPDDEGGWVLKDGQLSQPVDDPRVGATLGTEVW